MPKVKSNSKYFSMKVSGFKNKKFLFFLIAAILFLILFFLKIKIPDSSSLYSPKKNITIAVASNFSDPFMEISEAYSDRYHVNVEKVISSSGKLYSQIIHGAPFDFFLSADSKMPAKLHEKGFSLEPFIYARGKVVLWFPGKRHDIKKDWGHVILDNNIKKISIANIETAPYGTGAMIALQKKHLWTNIQERLIFTQTVSQAFLYSHLGNTDAAFCAKSYALSSMGKNGSFIEINEAPVIIQSACIIKKRKNNPDVESFARFLQSDVAKKIMIKYGYK